MPKTPITSRTLLYETLEDGTSHLLDFCLVTTSVGTMVEWRNIARRPGDEIKNEDVVDSSFTNFQLVREGQATGNYALDQLLFNGSQWPHYRTSDPGAK